MDLALSKGRNQFSELADFNPDDLIDKGGNLGIGLAFESDGYNLSSAQCARLSGEDEWQGSISGDDANRVRREITSFGHFGGRLPIQRLNPGLILSGTPSGSKRKF